MRVLSKTTQLIVIYMAAWGYREKKKQLSCPRSALFIFHSTSAKFDSTSDISFHENNNKKTLHTPANTERGLWDLLGVELGVWGGALSIKGKQAGWRQLGFSIQFSCPEPWKTG